MNLITKQKIFSMIKKAIGFILVGVCLGVTGVYIYWCYNLSKTVSQNTATLSQVVQYLNQEISKNTSTTAQTANPMPNKTTK